MSSRLNQITGSLSLNRIMHPGLIIIGAYKCGTTALYNYLNQHPQIYMTPIKETNFFALRGKAPFFKGPGDEQSPTMRLSIIHLDEYQKQFDTISDRTITGEASPLYLYEPSTAQCIASYRPDVKLIVILRQPAERAYSNFIQKVREGRERLSGFQQALEQEPERIKNNWEPIWFFREAGLYYSQLKRYFDYFPPEQIKVILQEDLLQRPKETFIDLFRFIGVDETFQPNTVIKHNQSRIPINGPIANLLRKSLLPFFKQSSLDWVRLLGNTIEYPITYKPKLSQSLKRQLTEFYYDDIIQLQTLIQRDLSHWLE